MEDVAQAPRSTSRLEDLERTLKALEEKYVTPTYAAPPVDNTSTRHQHATAGSSESQALQAQPVPAPLQLSGAHPGSDLPVGPIVLSAYAAPAASSLLAATQGSDYIARMSLYDPNRPMLQLTPAGAAAARLHDKQAHAMRAPGALASTWEAQRARALVAMEQQMRTLEVQQQARAQQGGRHIPGPGMGGKADEGNENAPPADGASSKFAGPGVSVGAQPVKYYPPPVYASTGPSLLDPNVAPATSYIQPNLKHAQPGASGGRRVGDVGATALAAAPAAAPQSTGAWERSKSAALLALHRERDALASQLDQYARLDTLHARKMEEIHAKHAEALRDAQGGAGRRLEVLYESSAKAFNKLRGMRTAARMLAGWRMLAQRTRRVKWAQHVWGLRMQQMYFSNWHLVVLEAKRRLLPENLRAAQLDTLLAWRAQARASARLRRLGTRAALIHLRHITLGWQAWAARHAAKATRYRHAARLHSTRVHRGVLVALQANASMSWEAAQVLVQRVARLRVRLAFHAWAHTAHLAARVTAVVARGRARRTLRAWASHTTGAVVRRHRVAVLQVRWAHRQLSAWLLGWRVAASRQRHLREAEQQIRSMTRLRALAQAFRQLSISIRVERFEREVDGRQQGRMLRAWRATARQRGRARRVTAAAILHRDLWLAERAMHAWRLLGAWRRVRLHTDDTARMQAYVASLQEEVDEARAEQFAALGRAAALSEQAVALRAEATRGFVLGTDGGLLDKSLCWRSLPPNPDDPQPPARARHSSLYLPGIQLARRSHSVLAAGATAATMQGTGTLGWPVGGTQTMGDKYAADHTLLPSATTQLLPGEGAVVPELSSTILVFGGVAGDAWLRDVQVVSIRQTEGMDTAVSWAPLTLDTSRLPLGRLGARRDHAACPAGPSCFVVIGGFDGHEETMDVLLFQVDVRDSTTNPASDPATSLSGTVLAVQPASRATPTGRAHHTAAYHEAGRALLVFGGYASYGGGGYLNELWVFNMDSLEWWQPDVTGDLPSRRRGHVSVIIGSTLYVYGGFDGERHLDDLWALDVATWHWSPVRTQGALPGARRGHAADVVGDRYLLIHGGFDGTRHLADAHVLDTATATWNALCVAAGPEDSPAPRALHSLTVTGPSCVLLGGTGPLGALTGVHLLESRAVASGLAQQQKLLATLAQLATVTARCTELQQALALAQSRADSAGGQLQVLEARCAALAKQHNRVLHDMDALRGAAMEEAEGRRAAEEAAEAAKLALGAAERRLLRARSGGREVAAAASEIHEQLEEARTANTALAERLAAVEADAAGARSATQQLSGERSVLQMQLATANNEVSMLRALMGSMPQSMMFSAAAYAGARAAAAGVDSAAAATAATDHAAVSLTRQALANAEVRERRLTSDVDTLRAELAARPVRPLVDANPAPPPPPAPRVHSLAPESAVPPPHTNAPGPSAMQLGPLLGGGVGPDVQSAAGLLAQGPLGGVQAHLQELAEATARALTAEHRLHLIEKDYAAVKGELAALAREVERERGAARAARETCEQAVAALRAAELVHMQQIERLEAQLRAEMVQRWQADMTDPAAAAAAASARGTWGAQNWPPAPGVTEAGLQQLGASFATTTSLNLSDRVRMLGLGREPGQISDALPAPSAAWPLLHPTLVTAQQQHYQQQQQQQQVQSQNQQAYVHHMQLQQAQAQRPRQGGNPVMSPSATHDRSASGPPQVEAHPDLQKAAHSRDAGPAGEELLSEVAALLSLHKLL